MGADSLEEAVGHDCRRGPEKHRAPPGSRQIAVAIMEDVIEMSRQRFEELVAAAMDQVPGELYGLVDNCVVLVEDDPPADDPDLLGVYDGTPLTERGGDYTMVLPDRITVFRNPTLAMCEDEDQVVEEVNITVVHEIAHHFGIDDERLHELGYG